MSQRIDRRRFLLGAGGALLALPMLEATAPRKAFADPGAPPKRVVFMIHYHGRSIGGRIDDQTPLQDNWSPAAAGPLPTTGDISPLLAALGPIRDKIVTIDGVDNIMRAATGDTDGHASAAATCLTCSLPNADLSAGAPSIDYVVGTRLRADASRVPSYVFAEGYDFYESATLFGAGGSAPYLVDHRPEQAVIDLFGSLQKPNAPPPAPTLRDRIASRRKSILDAVSQDLSELRKKVNATDRDRLDAHASFIQGLETRLQSSGQMTAAQGCMPPDPMAVAAALGDYSTGDTQRGEMDDLIVPYQLENMIQALACDITRVAVFEFHNNYDYAFQAQFGAKSPFLANNWPPVPTWRETSLLSKSV